MKRSIAVTPRPAAYAPRLRVRRATPMTPIVAERDDPVPGARLEALHGERGPEVVRQEERGERGDDQIVEEERPACDEAGEVVEGAPDEGRRAAGLPQLRRSLGVRQRDDEEDDAREEQDVRREAERLRGDDPEREVDRAGDLAVRDAEQVRRAEPALKPRKLSRHEMRLTPSHEVQPPGSRRDEERAEQVPDDAASVDRRHDEHREPIAHERHARTRRRQRGASGRFARRDDHDAARRVLEHVVRRAAEDRRAHVPGARCAHDDDLAVPRCGLPDDRAAGAPVAHEALDDVDAVRVADRPRLRRAARRPAASASGMLASSG